MTSIPQGSDSPGRLIARFRGFFSSIRSWWIDRRRRRSQQVSEASTFDDAIPFSTVLNEEIGLIRRPAFGLPRGADVPAPAPRSPVAPREPAPDRGLLGRIGLWYSRLKAALKPPPEGENDGSPAGPAPVGDGSAEKAEKEAREMRLDENLVGLAFPGGGIRSATFNLGILQGLAEFGLLKNFDYLSTVSGGGYIGSWLTSWIKREKSLKNVEKQLRPSRVEQSESFRTWEGREPRETLRRRVVKDEEPEPIYHLRTYSNYLAPKTGLLSVNTWVLIAIYLRNLLLNQLIILPATLVLILLTRYMIVLYKQDSWPVLFGSGPALLGWYDFLAGAMVGLSLRALISTSYLVRRIRRRRMPGRTRRFHILPMLRTPLSLLGLAALALLPPGRGILASALTSPTRSFASSGPASFFDGVVLSGAILGVFLPEYLVGVVVGTRRLFIWLIDMIREAVGLGRLPRYEDADDDTSPMRGTQLGELQLGILLPILASALIFCQQFEVGQGGQIVRSPWLYSHVLGGPRGDESVIWSLIPGAVLSLISWLIPGASSHTDALCCRRRGSPDGAGLGGLHRAPVRGLAQSFVALFYAAKVAWRFWKRSGRTKAVESLWVSIWSAVMGFIVGLLSGVILFFAIASWRDGLGAPPPGRHGGPDPARAAPGPPRLRCRRPP